MTSLQGADCGGLVTMGHGVGSKRVLVGSVAFEGELLQNGDMKHVRPGFASDVHIL